MMLAAEGNGVKVSNLTVSAGSPSTVTFDVQWTNDHAPEFVWSDTVWVWVDYNNNGVMERLPLLSGATLTATSASGVGKVVEDAGNNQGRWLVGNARDAGSFSATVQLLTALADFSGACAYASNYPPVGKYASASEILFTGTPPYEVVLKANSGSAETHTADSDSPYAVLPGYTVQSFTDKTGAPGIINCALPVAQQLVVSSSSYCAGSGVTFALANTQSGASYQLHKDGVPLGSATLTGKGSAATFSGSFTAGTYTAQTVPSSAFCLAEMRGRFPVAIISGTTAPGSTVDFTAFAPCSAEAVGTTWHLIDKRESSNNQTDKVRKMHDVRIWMVQDLRFGNLCGTGFSAPSYDQIGLVSNSGTYYGDCTARTNGSTPGNRGYLYAWAAAVNKSGAHYGGSYQGCSGTGATANTCQGICPAGWHIPTGSTTGEFYALHNAPGRNCSTSNDDCWDANSAWEGVYGGDCDSNGAIYEQGRWGLYWSSTTMSNDYLSADRVCFGSTATTPSACPHAKNSGRQVRCIRNY
jgi:uncharacterized protein (TIGR02145 family)